MEKKRNVPETKYHRAMDLICKLLQIMVILSILLGWSGIPDKVPMHYGAGGTVDAYASKYFVFFCPVVTFLMNRFLRFLERRPEFWNIPVSMDRQNRDRIYMATKSLIVSLRVIVVALFSYIGLRIARGKPLGTWFLPVILVATFGLILVYTIYICKISKEKR